MRRAPDVDDDDDDWPDDDDDGYVTCPHCGEMMLEAADYCPSCDRWITSEGLPPKRHPWWIAIVILVLLAMIILSILPF